MAIDEPSRCPSRGACCLFTVAWLLTALSPAAPASAASPRESREERAAALVAAGQLEAAEELYLEWLGTSPDTVEPYAGLLEVWVAKGTVERVPRLVVPAGERWLEGGRVETARALAEEAVARVPGCTECWGLLGRIHIEQRNYRAAETAFERALEGSADSGEGDPMLSVLFGLVLWENGAPERAEAVLAGLPAEGASGALARQHLARLWLWQGRYVEAAEALGPIVARQPGRVDLRLDLARALEGSGRLEEARREFERVVNTRPEEPGALYGLARVLDRLGEPEAAREAMARFAEFRRLEREALLAEGRREATRAEARRLLASGAPDAAARLLEELPLEGETPTLLARALLAAGDQAAARRVLRRALARDPSRVDLSALLAELGPYAEGDER